MIGLTLGGFIVFLVVGWIIALVSGQWFEAWRDAPPQKTPKPDRSIVPVEQLKRESVELESLKTQILTALEPLRQSHPRWASQRENDLMWFFSMPSSFDQKTKDAHRTLDLIAGGPPLNDADVVDLSTTKKG